ncbi:MAG: hypothetical protein RIF39_06645 [Cyclobacteriaceae bacterium]
MLEKHGDWMELGSRRTKAAKVETVEAWGRSKKNPGGWYGLKKKV